MKNKQDAFKKKDKKKHHFHHTKKPQFNYPRSRILPPDQFMRSTLSSLAHKNIDEKESFNYIYEVFALNNQNKIKEIKIDPFAIPDSQKIIDHFSKNADSRASQLKALLNKINNDIKRISRTMKNQRKRQIQQKRRETNRRHRNGWDSLQKQQNQKQESISGHEDIDSNCLSEQPSSSDFEDSSSISEESDSYSSEDDMETSKAKRWQHISSNNIRFKRENRIRKSVEKYDYFAQPNDDL